MPRYVIERTYDVDEDEMPNVATRSKRIAIEHFPAIVWAHSHVVVDGDGTLKSFCVYDAPNPEAIRRVAERNKLPVDRITEVRVLDPYFYR